MRDLVSSRLILAAVLLMWPITASAAQVLPPVIDLALGQEDIRILGDDNGDRLGAAVAVGDLNGDCFADIVLGAPNAQQGSPTLDDAGEVAVILGTTALPATVDLSATPAPDAMRVLGGEAFARMGSAVAVGDLNGDGFDDIAIGAPDADPLGQSGSGAVFLVFGAESLPATVDTALNQQDVTIQGAQSPAHMGTSLAIGDLNADGIDDLAIGAPDAPRPDNLAQAGEVYVLFGRSAWASTITLLSEADKIVRGAAANDATGTAVAIGDLDGDGYADLLVGSPGVSPGAPVRSNAGEVAIIDQETLAAGTVIDLGTPVAFRIFGDGAGDGAGSGLAMADANGDGVVDVVIGATGADVSAEADAGRVYFIKGRFSLSDVDLSLQQESLRILGREGGEGLGAVLALGDIDGEGQDDGLLGIPLSDPGLPARTDAGELDVILAVNHPLETFEVLSLAADDQDGQLRGDDSNDLWSSAVAAGDINRDGFADIVLGAPDADPGPAPGRFQAGEAAIVFGTSNFTSAVRPRRDRPDDAPPGDFGPVLRAVIDYSSGQTPGPFQPESETTATLTRSAPTGSGLPMGVAAVRWQLTTDRDGWLQAGLTLKYTDAEIAGLDESRLQIYRADAETGPWTRLGTTVDTRANRVTATTPALGHFAIGEGKLSDQVVDYLLGILATPPTGADANSDTSIDAADVVTLILGGL